MGSMIGSANDRTTELPPEDGNLFQQGALFSRSCGRISSFATRAWYCRRR
jgi:hypothetical protein